LGLHIEVAKELGMIADRNRIRIRPPRPRPILPLDRDTVEASWSKIEFALWCKRKEHDSSTDYGFNNACPSGFGAGFYQSSSPSINPLLLLEITAIQMKDFGDIIESIYFIPLQLHHKHKHLTYKLSVGEHPLEEFFCVLFQTF
jgi:hypothetical protein